MRFNIITKIFLALAIALTPAAALILTSFDIEAASAAKPKSKSKKKSSGKKNSNKKGGSKKGKSSTGKKKKKKNRKGSKNSKSRRKSHSRSTRKRNYRSWAAAAAPKAEQPSNDSLTLAVNDAVLKWIPEKLNPGGLRVNSVRPNHSARATVVGLNENFTYLPVTREFISGLQNTVRRNLPDSIHDYNVTLNVGRHPLSYYIATIDKLPEKYRKNTPFVREKNSPANPVKGMDGDIVALWPSHGRYYKNGGWYWQRPVLFQTLEDIYTLGYIYPFAVPMLENAGAYVFLPRERDPGRHEVIVDNDTNEGGELFSQPYYREISADRPWTTGTEDGFIYDLKEFRDTENPFEVGTYRQTSTIKSGKPSLAAWYADIPEDGDYAVYVSYKSLPESADDALYTVNYSGGSKEFTVNQTMGGSTWIYLGTFPLDKGYSDNVPVVTLSNLSATPGKIVTADAVKIGGGMGNIARSPRRADVYFDPSTPVDDEQDATSEDEETEEDEGDGEDEGDNQPAAREENAEGENGSVDEEDTSQTAQLDPKAAEPAGRAPRFITSGLPRYLEGARYWLQWAGFPEEVYSPYHGSNDYKDDYTSRGIWVNYLAGGSRVLPDNEGLRIPVDACLALHSDAGKRSDDSTVGTLGIYYSQGGASYDDGTPRINSRILTDMVMRQITGDIRQTFEPDWKRRSMWDKSYVEARVPEVPTTLIELMSHQNFRDMQYGLDPAFRFLVGRSIYKAMARFIGERKGREVVIQPLPVKDFCIKRQGRGKYRLSWRPTTDRLEPTAKPNRYIIYERSAGTRGFRVVGETRSTSFNVAVRDNDVHSFRVVASNDGGLSFPSETLSLREAPDGKPGVLIVNGFTRVAAPGHFSADGEAGFDTRVDFGVPLGHDLSYAGAQYEFRRSAGDRFGASSNDMIGTPVAGNTFDFAVVHGNAIAKAGYGFVSSSLGAIESGAESLRDYKIVDLILGRQKATVTGGGNTGVRYRAFPTKLQHALHDYLRRGGDLLVSGEYVASDLTGTYADNDDRDFADRVLHIAVNDSVTSSRAAVEAAPGSPIVSPVAAYNDSVSSDYYIVQRPDRLIPAEGSRSESLLNFAGTNDAAALGITDGKSRRIVMSVPFESLTDPADRATLMQQFLKYLDQ